MTHNKKVILSTQPPPKWRYWDFVYLNGTNPIEVWYQALPEDIRDTFDALLKNNQKTKLPLQWTGFRKYLQGGNLQKYKVWELEFRGEDGLAHRMMGVFEGAQRAIFLIGCYHKGGNYTPSNALVTAAQRASLLTQKGANTIERPVKSDI